MILKAINEQSMHHKQFFLSIIIITILCSCTNNSAIKQSKANKLAEQANFISKTVNTNYFTIQTYHKLSNNITPLNVYIEGDGLSWINKYRLSSNPTPTEPLVLELATYDPNENILYIARPCQYIDLNLETHCNAKYWSKSRFSEEVISSIEQVINHYRSNCNQKVNIIGYSGGGNIAAIIAARNKYVISLRTIAGNLDHVTLHHYHNVTQLNDSLNAIDFTKNLKYCPQLHLIGVNDIIVPEIIVGKFAKKINNPACISIIKLAHVDHYRGWSKIWSNIIKQPLNCK